MSTTPNKIWTPITYGSVEVNNRVVMAPLTRIRSDENLAPTDMHVKYYRDRADNNLIITEATIISQQSISSKHIPGCFNELQAKAWRKVTDAVHEKDAKVSMQAWHEGRAAHPSYSNHPLAKAVGAKVCESSCEIAVPGPYTTVNYHTGEMVPYEKPRMMTKDDIKRFYQQLLDAAELAFTVANFDLYELHGAHGYLFDQFLNDGTNTRTDEYGGSFENRFRLMGEALELLCAKYPGKIAIRISPHDGSGFHEIKDSNPVELYNYVYTRLGEYDLAYILCTEPRMTSFSGLPEDDESYNLPLYSAQFTAKLKAVNPNIPVIGCGGFTAESACKVMDLKDGPYDAIGFGRWYISSPDLVYRFKHGLPWTRYNRKTFYLFPPFPPDTFEVGYNDYPTFEQQVKKVLGDDIDMDKVIHDKALIAKVVEAYQDDQYALIPLDVIGMSRSSVQRETK